ncbi:single-stranded DNA-binding protein [Mucilaginibacter limnophilus]|uniref:Single-stranded DNA-binding protein n=1 Tax=Mucilaginibacter limnophilus TaxID=1932778 RepID=A0A437MLD0_9SPHI|nr:single-stranded DNA-binding protein [Mucilaginibacter limnophilus]RVT98442.1 single-stranded DNA-binding protein [Mucilaginibacter limnophilus]
MAAGPRYSEKAAVRFGTSPAGETTCVLLHMIRPFHFVATASGHAYRNCSKHGCQQLFPETRVKKNAMLGTDGPYERIMPFAALRSPFGTYSSPVPYRSGSWCFLFFSFFFEKNYPGRVAESGEQERNNGQNLFIKNKNVMEITGRLVADATVRAVNADKNVTVFRVAINRSYRSQGERKQETAFVDCTYWRTDAIAPFLTKGMLVQLSGFMTAEPWVSRDGEPMASLKFRTDEINLLTKSAKPDSKHAKKRSKKGVLKPSEQFN